MPQVQLVARAFLLLAVGCAPPVLRAQQPAHTVVAREIEKARRSGQTWMATQILRQTDSVYSTATLDALADSLVAIVLETDSSEGARLLRSSALSALSVSGMSEGKVPYLGAGKRLFKIAQEAPRIGDRGEAIGAITSLANSAEALVLLRRIAVSDNPAAGHAVNTLWQMMPEKGGLEVLRELARSDAIQQPTARRALEFVVRKYGWK